MFEQISPEEAGISSKEVSEFLNALDNYGFRIHSTIMMINGKIFEESYREPFYSYSLQRMYSVAKSLVGIAVGLLEEDGKLSLDAPLYTYFTDICKRELPEELKKQTIRDNLMMCTSVECEKWFTFSEPDRVSLYFNNSKVVKPAGTLWAYDSPGSQVLCALVEKIAGKPILEFLRERIFNKMGSFINAKFLRTPTGVSWGDSGLLCTLRDMASFGQLLINDGMWDGEQLINNNFVKKAISPQVCTQSSGLLSNSMYYGYQIWCPLENCFAFFGMGDQICLCNPKLNFIFACTADNQGIPMSMNLIINEVKTKILDKMISLPLKENPKDLSLLRVFEISEPLYYVKNRFTSPVQERINKKEFTCEDNPMGISKFSLSFGKTCEFKYTNKTGEKTLLFSMGQNTESLFPEEGYSKDIGAVPCAGHKYKCMASAGWRDERRLEIFVQIIDEYLGNLTVSFGFNENTCFVTMAKSAEAFLNEYSGKMTAYCS